MMQLSDPQFTTDQTITECSSGMPESSLLRRNLADAHISLCRTSELYLSLAKAGSLHSIAPLPASIPEGDPIMDALSKADLIKLYDQYFVPESKPARRIYDALLNASKGRCPFCGGIGTPRNLDHYLPKAHFPQFSILPFNLVPACRDCNMDGKAHSFATIPEDQVLHPYADNSRFFRTQWVFAEFRSDGLSEPGEFHYFVNPPVDWSDVDKKRVRKHFDDFDLSRRYATKAAETLRTVQMQIQSMQAAMIDSAIIINALLQPGINAAPFINHWQRGMYQALLKFYAGNPGK